MIPGILYIVATPIGNLKDITLRAVEILKEVDLIAAEDTRHSKTLLQQYSITTPTISLHNYNEERRSQVLIDELKQGKNIALISDAGTPLISDPGYRLARLAHEQQIKIVPIPGACAAIAALSVSGLATDRFVFEGFLPVKKVALEARLQSLAAETRTIIIYESTHRLLRLLEAMAKVWGDERKITLAKELTKTFESVRYGNINEIKEWLQAESARQKGEFVVLVEGAVANRCAITQNSVGADQRVCPPGVLAQKHDLDPESTRILHVLLVELPELPTKQAAAIVAQITGANKRELYRAALVCKPEKH